MKRKRCPECGHWMEKREKDIGVSDEYKATVIHWKCTNCSHYEIEYI